MKDKTLYSRALKLAVPMMIQNGITNMVGLVDNIMVGSIGTEQMTAVSIACQLMFVFNLSVFGGLSGPGIYGAQYYGNGDTEGVRNTFRMKLWICIFCVVMGVTIFACAGSELIGLYLKGESGTIDKEATLKYGLQYLHIMIANIFPFAITQVYSTSLRETGDSVKPMVAGIVSVFVDVVLNYMLIYGNFGMPKMGVRGAAIATVCARIVEMTIVIVWAHAKKNEHTFLQGIYSKLKVPFELMKKMIKKGFPIFLNEFLWAGGIAAITQNYSVRGTEIVAGINISNALCNLFNVVFVAMGSAVGILIGQTLGAGETEKARKDSFKLMWFTGGICVFIAAILISISGLFPKVYDTSDYVRNLGSRFIAITAMFFPVQGFLNALYFTLRSGGKTFITFLFDSVYSWVVAVPMSFLLCEFTDVSIYWILVAVQAADIIKVIIGYILIKRGVWINNLAE